MSVDAAFAETERSIPFSGCPEELLLANSCPNQ